MPTAISRTPSAFRNKPIPAQLVRTCKTHPCSQLTQSRHSPRYSERLVGQTPGLRRRLTPPALNQA